MRKQGCVCILTMVLFAVLLNSLFVNSAKAATITVPTRELKKEGFDPAPPSCQSIQVTSPVLNQWCYINEICTISWDKSNLTSYGSVFLHVVQWDAQHPTGWEGGGYPVANTGSYQWTVPENVGPLENTAYFIRIKTPDGKCEGRSPVFGIKKKVLMNIPRERIKIP